MRPHHQRVTIAFPAAFPQILDQFLTGIELSPGWLLPVEIADQTNPQADVVHIIAVNVAPGDLTSPTIPNLDLTVAR